MRRLKNKSPFLLFFCLTSCVWNVPENRDGVVDSVAVQHTDSFSALRDSTPVGNAQDKDTAVALLHTDTAAALPPSSTVDVKDVPPDAVVSFAESLIGTPYQYASTDPQVGFDCSGFITYVFNHFGIAVPRSSIDFTNVGKTVPVEKAKRGDLILFTGTDSTERFVGHLGIVVSNTDTLRFIHSSSGKANGVTVTPLNNYYRGRFVRITRIFPQNDKSG